jgi:uncharacterized membrane protein
MLFDLSPYDILALVWLFVAWFGFDPFMRRVLKRNDGLNQRMARLRVAWMEQLLRRENRITDASLFGHTIHSITFFASTTMLVLAGLVGLIGALDRAFSLVTTLSFATPVAREVFECKLILLLGIFIYAFMCFTWALRQYNYLCAVVGAAPSPPVADRHRAVAQEMGDLLSLAVSSFNNGLRAYYFALAVLAWLVGPGWFMLATLAVVAMLVWRQYASPTAHLIAACTDLVRPPER